MKITREYEKQYDFQPGEFPIWIRRMPGKVRDKIWTPFSVHCSSCGRRHSCRCPFRTKQDERRARREVCCEQRVL